MPSITRREALAAATTGLAMLAGCTGSETSETRRAPAPREDPIAHEFVHVREPTATPLFVRRDRTTTRDERPEPRGGGDYLVTAEEVEQWEFAATDAGERLRTFTAETDFETESVFLYATPVGECREIHLQQVAVDPDGNPQVDFCRSTRPADVACSAESRQMVGFAIRLPITGEGSSGFGTGMGSHCNRPERPPAFDATVTVEGGAE
ncbi:Uncharacterized protein HSRCO_0303 [Halanaeroarchaeum sp. HSR-CO]|uniref:hypothetical protein n=1 Tax=Halanaeroarchaeum sp. HSR-CO TaxID=2866382 RepID=UPI00217D9908|nr:hypothetical protein [Halanaeroarchaeum sp. HSR-CO]UWG46602.1 Uncharacterized protein HSRCO_0303 [Halanaeroarchaeum sp. HSR-CO]